MALRLLPLLVAAAVASACGSTTASPSTHTPAATPAATATPSPTTTGITSLFPPVAGQPPVSGRPWFLAIGDSVTAGFSVDPARLGTNASWALQLQGLLAASGRNWTLYDTACAGERTDTYSTRCPRREATPFLLNASQHDVALAAVTAHRADLRAIFVDLGSNDLFAAQRDGTPLDTAISALRQALTAIVSELHRAAPGVPVIVCNFYDPEANALPGTLPELQRVNAMVAQLAAAQSARLADFFSAINTVTGGNDPHLCDWVDCAHSDVHPTVAGHARLAAVALAALDGKPSPF